MNQMKRGDVARCILANSPDFVGTVPEPDHRRARFVQAPPRSGHFGRSKVGLQFSSISDYVIMLASTPKQSTSYFQPAIEMCYIYQDTGARRRRPGPCSNQKVKGMFFLR